MRYRDMILVIWCQCFAHLAAGEQAALVFDRFNSSLFEVPPDTSAESQCGAWANACPAEDEADDKFIKETALTENALFVKQICTKDKTVREAEFKTDICENAFQISVLFNKTKGAFVFGYEIYFRPEDKQVFHTHYRAEYYVSPKKIFKAMKEKKFQLTKLIFNEIIRLIIKNDKNYWYNGDRKLRFMWINLFKIEFDFFKWTPTRIVYQIRKNNKWPVAWSCEKYDLVAEAYEGIDLDYLYQSENQKKIFSNLQLPEETSEAACKPNCLIKWLLIPIDQFHFGSLEYSLCSNMATVPIWSSTIREVMIKLEKFLYALYKISGVGLYITSGTSGRLKLAKIDKKRFRGSKADVYLDMDNQRIPVPEILYKVVKYKPNDCPKEALCWYSATIVIHNDPNFDPNKDKICKDVTADWGWIEVTKQAVPESEGTPTQSSHIYVCQSGSKLLNRLMGYSAGGEPSKTKDLNLNEFPSYDAQHNLRLRSIITSVLFNFIQLINIERGMRPPAFDLFGIEETDQKEHPTTSKPPPLKHLDSIEEADEDDEVISPNDIEDGPQRNVIIERPRGDLDDEDVVATPMFDDLDEDVLVAVKEEDDEDILDRPIKKRLLHTTPDPEIDEQPISDEDEENGHDEISDSEIRERSFHKDDFNTEVGSGDEGKSPKESTKASSSSNLEEQSSPRKNQSFREEKMDTESDSKDEGKSPEESIKESSSDKGKLTISTQ